MNLPAGIKSKARPGDSITIFSNEKYNVKQEDIAIETATALIALGVKNTNKRFCTYFHDGLKPGIASLLLKFTYNNKIIYGVSVDENEKERARDIHTKID